MNKKILTFSFDDGVMQDIKVIKILNKYNLKATFNLNSGLFEHSFPLVWDGVNVERKVVSSSMVKEIYAGHEVAVHTVNHAMLTQLSDDEIVKEVVDDVHNLEALVGYKVEGMAYPRSDVNDRVLKVVKERTPIKYARTTDSTHSLELQEDLLKFNPSCRVFDDDMYSLADELINFNGDKPKLLYIWAHCYEFDYKPGKYERFEEFCKYISGRNDITYCTNIEAFKTLGQV